MGLGCPAKPDADCNLAFVKFLLNIYKYTHLWAWTCIGKVLWKGTQQTCQQRLRLFTLYTMYFVIFEENINAYYYFSSDNKNKTTFFLKLLDKNMKKIESL